VSPTV